MCYGKFINFPSEHFNITYIFIFLLIKRLTKMQKISFILCKSLCSMTHNSGCLVFCFFYNTSPSTIAINHRISIKFIYHSRQCFCTNYQTFFCNPCLYKSLCLNNTFYPTRAAKKYIICNTIRVLNT